VVLSSAVSAAAHQTIDTHDMIQKGTNNVELWSRMEYLHTSHNTNCRV